MKKISEWLSKNTKVAMYGDSNEKNAHPMNMNNENLDDDDENKGGHFIQWVTSDHENFAPAPHNAKELVPGFYEIVETMQGVFFEKISMASEGLVKFPETTSDNVVGEIENFWEKEQLFKESKLAYKRGILLYGPPGSGKTCTIKLVINNVVKRKGIVIKFTRPSTFESGMKILRKIQPKTPVIVLMEDIDAILARHNESDVINILDGVTKVNKIVFLATTNYPEKLGSRILNRPSRFDKRFFIGMPNPESRRLYFEHIANNKLSKEEINKWVDDTENLSISHLKELYVSVKILGDEYVEALRLLKGMKTKLDSAQFDSFGSGEPESPESQQVPTSHDGHKED